MRQPQGQQRHVPGNLFILLDALSVLVYTGLCIILAVTCLYRNLFYICSCPSEGGMIWLEPLIELELFNSSFSGLSSC